MDQSPGHAERSRLENDRGQGTAKPAGWPKGHHRSKSFAQEQSNLATDALEDVFKEPSLDRQITGMILMKTLRSASSLLIALPVAMATAWVLPAMASEPMQMQIGGAVQLTPVYEGSQSYRVIGVPVLVPGSSDDPDKRVQFRGLDHLQFALINTNGFQFGPLVGYRMGREEDDGRLLHGLGDIDGGLVAGGFASYRFGALRASLSYHQQLTGDDTGGVLKFGVDGRHSVTNTFRLTGGLGATWADSDYMQSFFGVTAQQALASGHAAYSAEAGIKDVNLNIGSELQLAPQWILRLNGRYARLVGDAADSPVVESRDQWSGGAALTYSFSFSR